MSFRRSSVTLPVLLLACVVSAWAGYLVGAQKAFGRIPFYAVGQTIGVDSKFAIFAGWGHDEGSFRWSEGKHVAILLRPRRVPGEVLIGELKLRAAVGPQKVEVLLNGAAVTTLDVQPEGGRFKFPISAKALRPFEDNEFMFVIESPRRPSGNDQRTLGIAFESFTLRESAPEKGGA